MAPDPTAPPSGVHQPSFDDVGRPLIETTFVVLDLETTGLSAEHDRITEIGAVKVRGGETLGELSTFVHPGCPIPAAITALTGITDAMVRTAPTIEAVLPSLLAFLDRAVLVAHNARFDVGFLRSALRRHGVPRFDPVVVDTAGLARRLLRDEVTDLRLGTLARHLRSRVRPDHRAMTDARATVDVLHGLIERAGPLGATTLEDLRDLEHSRSDRRFRRITLVADAPRSPGTYRFLGSDGSVLYVGKATDLRARLRSYFAHDRRRTTEQLVRDTSRVEWTSTPTVLEAEIRELREIQLRVPRYNRRSTRPAPTAYVALTREAFPRLSVVQRPGPGHRLTIGPLPSRRIAALLVEAMNEVTGLRTCTDRLRTAQDHPACVLKHLGRCAAVCDGTQTSASYARVVRSVGEMLEDPDRLIGPLAERMHGLARDRRYEGAARARERLHALATALDRHRRHTALSGVRELVIARETRTAQEVYVLRHGRLAASLRLDASTPDEVVENHVALVPLDVDDPDLVTDPVGESTLVLATLERPETRVISVSGELSLPVAGGAAIARVLEERDRLQARAHGPGPARSARREERRRLRA